MLSDSTILNHIALQPKRSAGFKQLIRELGLHGDARGELEAQLEKLVAAKNWFSSIPIATPSRKPQPTRISSRDASPCTATVSASSFPTRIL